MTAVAFATAGLQAVLGARRHARGRRPVRDLRRALPQEEPSRRRLLPDFWRTFGPYLPAGAGTTLVRNMVYFGANAIGLSLVVLAGYLVAGALVVTAVRRRSAAPAEGAAEAEASAAASAVVV